MPLMSFEGYWQCVCEVGHESTSPYCYGECREVSDDCPACYPDEWRCPDCGASLAWHNRVDDTNCDAWGYRPLKQVGADEHGDVFEIPERCPYLWAADNANPSRCELREECLHRVLCPYPPEVPNFKK